MGTLHDDQHIFLFILCSLLLRVRTVLDNVVEKIKTHIICSITFFRKPIRLCDNVEKYCRAGQVTGDTIGACALNAGYLKLQTHTHNM
jgi:ADP-ribosylglycohydrolase